MIGLGIMGRAHLETISKFDNAELTAVCDSDVDLAEKTGTEYDCEIFSDHKELLKKKICDAVVIATPHCYHTDIGIDALEAGFDVLVEKPIAVHKADCQRLIDAHKDKGLVFAAMFQYRTQERYKKVKELIDTGQLGELIRVNWIITDWFRSDAYYRSSPWRATWKGEGGGVLLNQCPHQLDLLQWLCGMPKKVWGFCGMGKHHDIETEDEAVAYMEYENGATGVFITSTGETPGTNRLEIAGENGKVVAEGEKLTFVQNKISVSEFKKTTEELFGKPETTEIDLSVEEGGGEYANIFKNFFDAILTDGKLIAPAEEGINSVELANAMLYSSLTGSVVEIPIDGAVYKKKLDELIGS